MASLKRDGTIVGIAVLLEQYVAPGAGEVLMTLQESSGAWRKKSFLFSIGDGL